MKRRSHKSKTQRQREAYSKGIKRLDYEPTIDDSLEFPVSDEGKSDLSVSTIKTGRPPRWSEKLGNHLRENWIPWAIAAIVAIFGLLSFDFNRDLGTLEGKIEVMEDSIIAPVNEVRNDLSEIKSDIRDIDMRLHEQDLVIQRNQLKIENLSHREEDK